MDGIVVKRYLGGDNVYYLSLLSSQDFSLSANYNLPFFREKAQIDGSSCHSWFCFHDFLGKYVLYNITTNEVKSLPPYNVEDPSERIRANGCGVGYDCKSDDYKVVRNYSQCYPDGYIVYYTDLYSLKSGSCKKILGPSCYISKSSGGLYLKGSYYWVAVVSGEIVRGLHSSDFDQYVLRFDFANETFSAIPLPPPGKRDTLYYLVDCGGSLAIITYPLPKASEQFQRPLVSSKSFEVSSSSKKSKRSKRRPFVLWVWGGVSWSKLYEAALHHVVEPLCLIDGRISFFQGNTRRKQCDLVIYDWTTEEMKRFDICDYPGHMQVFSNVDGGVELPPDANPINGPYTEETKTKAFLQPCVSQNASLVPDEAQLADPEEIPTRRRNRRKAYKEEDVSLARRARTMSYDGR